MLSLNCDDDERREPNQRQNRSLVHNVSTDALGDDESDSPPAAPHSSARPHHSRDNHKEKPSTVRTFFFFLFFCKLFWRVCRFLLNLFHVSFNGGDYSIAVDSIWRSFIYSRCILFIFIIFFIVSLRFCLVTLRLVCLE